MEKEITIRCKCGDHRFLTLWKDEEFFGDGWELAYSRHYLPLWNRIKYAVKLVFMPYSLEGAEQFLISDKDMKRIIKMVQKAYN